MWGGENIEDNLHDGWNDTGNTLVSSIYTCYWGQNQIKNSGEGSPSVLLPLPYNLWEFSGMWSNVFLCYPGSPLYLQPEAHHGATYHLVWDHMLSFPISYSPLSLRCRKPWNYITQAPSPPGFEMWFSISMIYCLTVRFASIRCGRWETKVLIFFPRAWCDAIPTWGSGTIFWNLPVSGPSKITGFQVLENVESLMTFRTTTWTLKAILWTPPFSSFNDFFFLCVIT